ncbi:hypothetical protein K438DRAFT_1988608 [Mycena galopus ATCC 62051]|nr:hypothetical protein K438DRAFT_1988608 [Mycena galopus ATCC 62051]
MRTQSAIRLDVSAQPRSVATRTQSAIRLEASAQYAHRPDVSVQYAHRPDVSVHRDAYPERDPSRRERAVRAPPRCERAVRALPGRERAQFHNPPTAMARDANPQVLAHPAIHCAGHAHERPGRLASSASFAPSNTWLDDDGSARDAFPTTSRTPEAGARASDQPAAAWHERRRAHAALGTFPLTTIMSKLRRQSP